MQTDTLLSYDKKPLSTVKTNYSFVNWIRLIAMFSIVYEHCLLVPGWTSDLIPENPYDLFTPEQTKATLLLIQPLKFGTICFFVISGFLLGKNLQSDQSPWAYYKRRLQVVGIPFLVALTIYYLKSVGFSLMTGSLLSNSQIFSALFTKLWLIVFSTTYWFISNFLVALALLLLCWRYTRTAWFGWVTALITLLYAFNVHAVWFETRHTFAVPAYVFYLWLGVYIARKPTIIVRLQHVSSVWSTIALIFTMGLALWESYYLWQSGSNDSSNSLRLTNQFFSLSVFIWLMRHNWLDSLSFLNPRDESFGIYLYHLFFVSAINKAYLIIPSMNALNFQSHYTGWELAGYHLLRFVLVYSATLLFVKVVNRTRFKWLFGN